MKLITKHFLTALVVGTAVVALSQLFTAVIVFAQGPTIYNRISQWPPQSGPAFSFGGPYEISWQPVPTALTSLDTKDSHIIGACVSNKTGGSINFTLQSNEASPNPLFLSGQSIPALNSAGSDVCLGAAWGVLSKSGFSVQAGAVGLYYHIVWTH